MSGIAGVVILDGADAPAAALERVMAATAHRAVHGSRQLVRGTVAFGHQLLDTAGSGPAMGVLAEQDGCLITADCRLDNREELVAALAADPASSDTALIVAAYRCWGVEAPGRLLGDFAFALWDPGQARLLCARDHFGIKPFYYALSDRAFAFSSEPEGALASGWADTTLSRDTIAAYLAGVAPQPDATFHQGIKRLPPAHVALIEANRMEVRPYWRLAPIDLSGEDAASGLHKRLELAVAARLRGPAQIGAMLSGGLDSSTVACLAAPLLMLARKAPLKTFSMVFDETPELNERPHIEAVLATIDARPHYAPSNGLSYLAALPDLVREQNGPFLGPNLPASRRIYDVARAAQTPVLLDGHGGDEVISFGVVWLAELAAAGRWLQLWRQVSSLARNEGLPAGRTFASLLMVHSPIARLLRPLWKLRAALRGRKTAAPGATRFLHPAYAERSAALGAEASATRVAGKRRTEQAWHLATVTGPLQAYALELLDRAAAAAGVEARYPFWDRHVVEFCCSVAAAEKLKDGRTRSLLRRSMAGVLPEQVRNRTDKFDFMPHLLAGLITEPRPAAEALFPDDAGLGEILALPQLRAAYDQLRVDPWSLSAAEVQALWRCAALALWWRRPEICSRELLMSSHGLA